jgi:anti-anti-sigma regulatory factor
MDDRMTMAVNPDRQDAKAHDASRARDQDYLGHHCPHWHRVGDRWRPLHEQLSTLHDASVWTGVADGPFSEDEHSSRPAAEASRISIACVQHGEDYAVVTVTGAATGRSAYILRAHLRSILDSGASVVVIDLSEVTLADIGLAAVLGHTWRRMRTRNGELHLFNVSAPVRSLLLGPLRDCATSCRGLPVDQ